MHQIVQRPHIASNSVTLPCPWLAGEKNIHAKLENRVRFCLGHRVSVAKMKRPLARPLMIWSLFDWVATRSSGI